MSAQIQSHQELFHFPPWLETPTVKEWYIRTKEHTCWFTGGWFTSLFCVWQRLVQSLSHVLIPRDSCQVVHTQTPQTLSNHPLALFNREWETQERKVHFLHFALFSSSHIYHLSMIKQFLMHFQVNCRHQYIPPPNISVLCLILKCKICMMSLPSE